MTYASETWPLTEDGVCRTQVAQRAVERTMLGISLRDRVQVVEISEVEMGGPRREKGRGPMDLRGRCVETTNGSPKCGQITCEMATILQVDIKKVAG